jgi:hypothetical protein
MKLLTRFLFIAFLGLHLSGQVLGQDNRASLQDNLKEATEQEKAQTIILLRSGGKWEVNLVGRTSGGTLKMRRAGQTGIYEYPLKDIAAIKFNLEVDEVEMSALFNARKFKDVVKAIDEPTRDVMRYMDIPNNANKLIMQMLRALFWDKQYEEAIKTCENIMRPLRTAKGPDFVEAELMKILSLQAMGKADLTVRMLDKMEPIHRKDPLATMWLHSMTTMHLSTNNWKQAAEYNAQLIAYGSKDFEWMPAGLYRSMEYYDGNTNYPVALQITEEIDIVAQNSQWALKAFDAKPKIEKRNTAYEAQLEAEKAAAAAERAKDPGKIHKTPTLLD